MSTNVQYYLICNKCGHQFIDPDGDHYGETEEEVKCKAEDAHWKINQGLQMLDYCPLCVAGA